MKNLLFTFLSVFVLSFTALSQETDFTVGTSLTVKADGQEFEDKNLYNISLTKELILVNGFFEDGTVLNTLYKIRSYEINEKDDNYIYKLKVTGTHQVLNLTIIMPKNTDIAYIYVGDILLQGTHKNLLVVKD